MSDLSDGADAVESPAAEVRSRLGPPPERAAWPPVSIVVVNRDGERHLRRLLAGLRERTEYPRFELILVDNASSDGSLDFVRTVDAPFPISILANHHNESFSDACNQGAEPACGDLLLFLNNDIEPFEPGWLRELVECLLSRDGGIAGSTLIRPDERASHGYSVQHRAIRLREESGLLRAELEAAGADPLGEGLGEDRSSPVAAGACMLIARELFDAVDGFTHGYLYGGEDIDLGLKVLAQGKEVICSGRSLLIHRLGSTRAKASAEQRRQIELGNGRLFWERWGPRLRREYELDRLAGGGFWAVPAQPSQDLPTRELTLALSFCLHWSEAASEAPGGLEALRAELARRHHPCTVLSGDCADRLTGLDRDVAVYLRGPARYVPKPGRLNVLWALSDPEALSPIECERYDLVLRGEDRMDELVDAVLARAAQLGLPARIGTGGVPTPPGHVGE